MTTPPRDRTQPMLHESRDDELDIEAKELLGGDVSTGLH
jgi:hypothetical protein